MNEKQLLSIKEAAELMFVQKETVRSWILDGELKAVKYGPRLWRVRTTEINKMIKKMNKQNEQQETLIKQTRVRLGWSTLEMSFALRVSTRTIWSWEVEKRKINHMVVQWCWIVNYLLDKEKSGFKISLELGKNVSSALKNHYLLEVIKDILKD